MKRFGYFWRYLAKIFLEWQMFQINVVEKIKAHILCAIMFFRKSHRLWYNVEKLGGDWGATNDVTIWSIGIACWICNATFTYAHAHAHAPAYPHARTHEHVCTHRLLNNTRIAFPRQQWFAHTPQRYFIRIFPLLLSLKCSFVTRKNKHFIVIPVEKPLCQSPQSYICI
jgi:hypothetical protein